MSSFRISLFAAAAVVAGIPGAAYWMSFKDNGAAASPVMVLQPQSQSKPDACLPLCVEADDQKSERKWAKYKDGKLGNDFVNAMFAIKRYRAAVTFGNATLADQAICEGQRAIAEAYRADPLANRPHTDRREVAKRFDKQPTDCPNP